jgi:WD40 repeat protein
MKLMPANHQKFVSRQFAAGLGFALALGASIHAADKTPAKGSPIAKVKHSGPVDFEKEILPILKNNCLACHNQTKAKAGLVLETPQAILKGGDNGPSVVPRKPRESLLLKAAAHQDEELIMPPRDNKVAAVALKPEELGLLQLWIEQGAKGQVRAAAPIAWQSMPSALNTIYAIALTRDGQFAACGRANQLFVYHLPSTQLVARLADVKLGSAAHRDTVNALVFSRDGEWLASGGYREVKLWRRAKPTNQVEIPDGIELATEGHGGKWIPAAITNGELRSFETNGTIRTNVFPKSMDQLMGDSRAMFLVSEAERELGFSKSEIEYRSSALKGAETNKAAMVARQKKAADTNAALAKVADEKAIAVTNAVAAKREAENNVHELGPEISKLVDAFFSAEKEFTNATALAKAAKDGPEKSKAAQLAAESETKSNLLAEAKAALEKLPAETKAKQKLVTEKLIAANKAIVDAEKEFTKAERTRVTAEHELQLADGAVRKSEAVVNDAKAALAGAETEMKRAEKTLTMAKEVLTQTQKPIRRLAFSTENHTLAAVDDAGSVRYWNVGTGAPFDPHWNSKWTLERTIGGGDVSSLLADRINALRFTADGQQLITGGGEPSRGGEIKIWRVKDGALLRDLSNVHSDSVFALDISPDGKLLASGAADRFAKVTELSTGKVLKVFEGHTHHVLGVAWKRDQRTLITAGADNVAKVWNAETGERRKNIEGFGKEVTAATFVGVGDEALLTAGDGQVVLLKDKGDKVRSFTGAADYVNAAAATPDGNVVVAGGADGILRTWSGKDGKVLVEFANR